MRILVTGASGFIGQAFTRLATSRGHAIAGLILPGEQPPPIPSSSGSLTWLEGTLSAPPLKGITTFAPEACLHLAWIATPGVYLESPENDDFARWSLDFIRGVRGCGVQQVVGVGTCIEYRITNERLSETSTPIEPTTRYARAKDQLRRTLEQDADEQGYRFSWGRVFYPYGPGEHPARLCSSLTQKLKRGETLELRTPDSTKDYIFIDDLAEAMLLTVERGVAGPINWGTGVGITIREVAMTLARLLGSEELVREATPPQPDPLGFVVADASRLRGLGWKPRVGLEEGLKKFLAD